ncbi:hypothetical protein BH10BDE1_BH10BDE1_18610 [soil metagenome]
MKHAVLRILVAALSSCSSAAFAGNDLAPLAKTSPTRTQVELDRAAALNYAHSYYDDDEDEEAAPAAAQEIWARMVENAWPDSMTPFVAHFQPGKSYLTLYKKFPVWPIDMRSPDRFKRSMTAHELANKSSIGHMSVGWSCEAAGQSRRSEGFAAQTGEDGGQSGEMMDSGWAVNSMISTFTDGRVQNGYNVQRYFSSEFINHIENNKDPAPYFALVIEVPTGDCEKVREFVKAYVLHPSKPWKNFGMLPDPNKFEGAGCGSFAVAALSHAPSLAPILNTYWRTLPVPDKLLGLRTKAFLPNDVIPFRYAKMTSQEREIGKVKLILKNWDSGKVALNLHLVDPELTIYSFRKFAELAEASRDNASLTAYQVENLNKTKRFYNFGSANDNDYPTIDHDRGFQEIDASFDPSFAQVSSSIESWWNERRTTQHMHVVSIPFGVGVMVDSAR